MNHYLKKQLQIVKMFGINSVGHVGVLRYVGHVTDGATPPGKLSIQADLKNIKTQNNEYQPE